MVKTETVGMWEVAKSNPVIKLGKDIPNYSFITYEGFDYLVHNTAKGDDSYREDIEIKAGDWINGLLLKAWEGQKLVIDAKHIDGGVDALEKDSILVVGEDGLLKSGDATGVYLKVTEKTVLTEDAVKAVICVA